MAKVRTAVPKSEITLFSVWQNEKETVKVLAMYEKTVKVYNESGKYKIIAKSDLKKYYNEIN